MHTPRHQWLVRKPAAFENYRYRLICSTVVSVDFDEPKSALPPTSCLGTGYRKLAADEGTWERALQALFDRLQNQPRPSKPRRQGCARAACS
jgi:hypothetical protein